MTATTSGCSMLEQRIRAINDDLWPTFAERDASAAPSSTATSELEKSPSNFKKQSSSIQRKRSGSRRSPAQVGEFSVQSAHTASSLRRMDQFMRLVCQQPPKIPKKLEQSSLRPVMNHLMKVEQRIEELQDEHASQLKLEKESQRTFEFMTSQINSLRRAFGVLSQVLMEEIEDIRAITHDHVKKVGAMLDETRLRGRLGLPGNSHELIGEVRRDMDAKITILHSNMLKLQTAIDENNTNTENTREFVRREIDLSEGRLTRMNKALLDSDDSNHKAIEKLEDQNQQTIAKQLRAEAEDHEKRVMEAVTELEHRIEESQQMTVSSRDIEALESNIESITKTVQDFKATQVAPNSFKSSGTERDIMMKDSIEKIRVDFAHRIDEALQASDDLRIDLEQIESAIISGFDVFAEALHMSNPLSVFEEGDEESERIDTEPNKKDMV